ncbi:unnamed protein product [Adineta steineri]|uniref:Uncharacterized protein n=1 Tax=Adineta steineri TaxID=433720 RepID=A0A813MVN7_9BILA|nr:unnamed protein product [Adineta steineri]CAF3594062.1 unnamed protein product [Adineta steineri]
MASNDKIYIGIAQRSENIIEFHVSLNFIIFHIDPTNGGHVVDDNRPFLIQTRQSSNGLNLHLMELPERNDCYRLSADGYDQNDTKYHSIASTPLSPV